MPAVVIRSAVSARRFLFLLALVATPLVADEPKISALSAVESGQKISVAFQLSGAFDLAELNKALESGLPTGFTYHIELYRKKRNWFDSTRAVTRLEVVCTYDSRTREYLLNYRRDGRLVRSETFSDIEKLRRRMVTISEPDLFASGGVPIGKLRVRVRADLMRGYLLYVIPWDVSTGWSSTRVHGAKAASE
jgi:hypothetical protein